MTIISFMLFKNHLSIFVISKISSTDMPSLKAFARNQSFLGLLEFSISKTKFLSIVKSSKPDVSVSSDLSAFPKASLKLLPIDITSPTDFICVPNSGRV